MTEGYTVLARRYRPKRFDEVVGQAHIASTLQNALRERRVGHAYLFCGPRGVGKTSMARIFAKALNCAKGPTVEPCGECESCRLIHEGVDQDVIEIDAASNRGVEDARTLRDSARYAPLRSRTKMYVLDEAHMLTPDAFNTLLKILEEPPPHLKFVFATTEAHKLPTTIVSRCQRFEFHRITLAHITERLRQVCGGEKLSIPAEILRRVAEAARGSMRDAESLLDQLIAFREDKITLDDVNLMVGAASDERVRRLFEAIRDADAAKVLEQTQEIFAAGVDAAALIDQALESVRALLILKACGRAQKILDVTDAARDALDLMQQGFSMDALLYFMPLLMEARRRLREGLHPQLVLEVAFVKMSQVGQLAMLGDALKGLRQGQVGVASPQPKAPPPPPPAASPAPPPLPPPAGENTLENIAARWKFLSEAVREQYPLIAAVLEDCRPAALSNGGALKILVPDKFNNTFHRDKIKKLQDLKSALESAAKQVFGSPVKIEFEFESGGARSTPSPASAQDPAIKKIVDKFQGTRIIEESE